MTVIGHSLGSVIASDAMFPFADGLQAAIERLCEEASAAVRDGALVLELDGVVVEERTEIDPIEALLEQFGTLGLRFVMIGLAVTPLRRLTGWDTLPQVYINGDFVGGEPEFFGIHGTFHKSRVADLVAHAGRACQSRGPGRRS